MDIHTPLILLMPIRHLRFNICSCAVFSAQTKSAHVECRRCVPSSRETICLAYNCLIYGSHWFIIVLLFYCIIMRILFILFGQRSPFRRNRYKRNGYLSYAAIFNFLHEKCSILVHIHLLLCNEWKKSGIRRSKCVAWFRFDIVHSAFLLFSFIRVFLWLKKCEYASGKPRQK